MAFKMAVISTKTLVARLK